MKPNFASLGRLRYFLPDFKWQTWAFIVAPAILCLSFILSIGPSLQQYAIDTLTSNAPSIYASSYEDEVVKFPNIKAWISIGLSIQYLSMSSIIIIYSIRAKFFRSVLTRIWISSTIVLLIADILSAPIDKIDLNYVLINMVSNFIGSFVAALLMGVAFFLIEIITKDFKELGYRALSSVLVVLFGIVLSSTAYFIFYYFYQPLPSKIEVSATFPTDGAYSSKISKSGLKDDQTPFVLLPDDLRGGAVNLISPNDSMNLKWKKLTIETNLIWNWNFIRTVCFRKIFHICQRALNL